MIGEGKIVMTDIAGIRSPLQAALDGLASMLRALANEWTGSPEDVERIKDAIEAAQANLEKARKELR